MAIVLRGQGELRSGGTSKLRENGDAIEPMASVANIVDAMLVLVLGLLIALITLMNVDLPQMEEIIKESQVTEIDAEKMMSEMTGEGSSYNELGTVYQDPATGKYYMLTSDVDKGASAAGAASTNSNNGK